MSVLPIGTIATFVQKQISTNQFLAGGAFLGLIAAFFAALRALPAKLWRSLMSAIFIEVQVTDRDEVFGWILRWLALQPYGQRRARSLMAMTALSTAGRGVPSAQYDGGSAKEASAPEIVLSPSRGSHWFIYRGRPVFFFRGKDEMPSSGGADAIAKLFSPEMLTLRILSRDRALIYQILAEARDIAYPKGERRTRIITAGAYCTDWRPVARRRPRPLESVILRRGIMEDCLREIQRFRAREQWYFDRGVPYRLGVELSGPPGSGKSSAVAAIAGHLAMDVATLNLAAAELDDDKFCELLADVPQNAILLIEDIDCAFAAREKSAKEGNKLTFSGLLNGIDGVAAGEGRILFVTTNRHDALDPALVRPGRVDLRYVIGAPDYDQIVRLYSRFFPDESNEMAVRFASMISDPKAISMAALQGLLIRYSSDPAGAIEHVRELAGDIGAQQEGASIHETLQ